jgi:hypothetical protein
MSFKFGDESPLYTAVGIVNVPSNVTSKKTLFAVFATSLIFPDYFGENWDAFEECVRDLSWLPAGRVIVKHQDVPLVDDVRDAKIYLTILRDSADKLSKSNDHPLLVVFPVRCRDQVAWLLRLS